MEEDVAFSILVLGSLDLIGVLVLSNKNCVLEQAHQDTQVVESPYHDSWCIYVCIITSVLARLRKFYKHPAAEIQETKVYQGNKTWARLQAPEIWSYGPKIRNSYLHSFMTIAVALLTHFKKYYPEFQIRASRHYCNINKTQLFCCIIILKESSQNAVIFISFLPLFFFFLVVWVFFSLSCAWQAS